MKSWAKWLVLAAPFAFPAIADEASAAASTMVLEGDASAFYTNGDFVIFDRTRAGGAVKTETAAPAEDASRPDPGILASAPIASDGSFRLEIPVEEPRVVFFYVENAVGPQGQRWARIGGLRFILEPGELKLRMSSSSRFVVEGGRYNDAVYNSWRLSDEYMAADAVYQGLTKPVEGASKEEEELRWDRMVQASERLTKLQMDGTSKVALTHPEPMVRRLAIQSSSLWGPWVLEAIRELARLMPDDPWVAERLKGAEDAEDRWAQERQLGVGDTSFDFTGETLAGDSVQLGQVRADNRYVLLDFWASWCGSCRVEFPHMKEAYDLFGDRGFEIVSYTIDDDREAWEEASAEEDLPWIDVGMGQESEAPSAYKVRGVPDSYLIDASTGKIIATDLRRHHLREKLEDLFEVADDRSVGG